MRETAVYCVTCGARIAIQATQHWASARQRYCSNACRQRAYRQRLAAQDATAYAEPRLTFEPEAVRGTFPIRLDKFIGRTRELESLGSLADNQLVTFTGPPGSGKTRLALRHAENILARSAAEIWWVDLADVEEGVAGAVGRVLGVETHGETALMHALDRRKHLVLVLDNCEHLLDECARFAETLLAHCSSLRMIGTSREAFRIPGEVVFNVGPLALPVIADAEANPRSLLRSDAVRLFVERASSSNPEFVLSHANAAAIVELCTELDGLPLPIELAARRVGMLSITDLLTRLRQSTKVLNLGSRTASSRHASLRATLDTSYDTLTGAERATLRRLSVLSGGFGLDVACAVSHTEDQTEQEIIDVICRLQAKSLLVASVESTQNVEFRQLNSLRRYARERLEAVGEVDATWDRLVSWLVDVSGPLRASIATPADVPAKLERLYGYLLSGAEWAAKHNDERHLQLVVALAQSRHAKRSSDMTDLLVRHALRATQGNEIDRALLLIELAYSKRLGGNLAEATALAQQAVEVLASHTQRPLCARALLEVAACQRESGTFDAAADAARAALHIARALGESEGVALCLESLAVTGLVAGRLDEALSVVDEALEAATSLETLCTAADIALAQGRLGAAEWYATQAVRGASAESSRLYRPLLRLAGVAIRRANRQRAVAVAAAARAMRPHASTSHGTAIDHCREAELDSWAATLTPAETRELTKLAAVVSAPAARAFVVGESDLHLAGTRPSDVALSPRQRTIASLVAEGLTNRQIATRVGVSPRTVAAQLAKLRTLLDLQSRAQIAAWAQAALQFSGRAAVAD